MASSAILISLLLLSICSLSHQNSDVPPSAADPLPPAAPLTDHFSAADTSQFNEFELAVWKGDVGAAEDLLVESQFSPNHAFPDGSPSICVAVLRGLYKMVVLLAKSGGNVTATVSGGYSPLHLAAKADFKDIAEFLYMYRPALISTAADDSSLPVHAAAAFGSVDVIKLFSYVKFDLNATTAEAVTPLMLAASAGHQHTLRLLLKGGANVSMSDKAGLQALHYASASGHEEVVLDLIKAGADINQMHAGMTSSPLAHALKGDHVPTARALLAAGAHLDADDANVPLLLMLAASCAPKALAFILSRPTPPSPDQANAALLLAAGVRGCSHSATVITSLLAAGASASAMGDQRSALMRAAESGSAEAFQVLIQAGANLSVTSADGANVFVIALMEKNEAVLRLLRPHVTTAMANPRSDSGQPALVAVASEGDLDTLLALLSHGARVSDVGEDGVTVAHALAAAGAAVALEKVLEYVKEGSGGTCSPGVESTGTGMLTCADEIRFMVTAREVQHGLTPLHVAASLVREDHQGQGAIIDNGIKVTQLLIQHGADIDAADKDGRTPLMTAIIRERLSVAGALLQANASVTAADMHGINSLMFAVRSGNNGLLLAAMQSPSVSPASLELALITAMYACNADASELLLMAGADARCLQAPDNPPAFLLAAACDGFEMLEMVDQYLAKAVATRSPSAKLSDRYGTTALMSAAASGNAGGVKWLLQAGANAAAADTRGRTALDYVLNPAAKTKLADVLPLLTPPASSASLPNRSSEEL